MKTISIATLATFLIPFSLFASELLPGSTLKLNSVDGLTDLSKVSAELSVRCSYKSGIFMPTTKSCGELTTTIATDSQNLIKIPAIEKFKGLAGHDENNYQVTLTLSEGKTWLAGLDAYYGTLPKFNFTGKTLNIYRVNGATLAISYLGADFFNSSLIQDKDARLSLEFNSSIKTNLDDLILVSPMNVPGLWSRDNLKSSYAKELLKDMKDIKLPGLAYASFSDPAVEKIVLSVYFVQPNNLGQNKNVLKSSVQLELSNDVLEKVGTIEIK